MLLASSCAALQQAGPQHIVGHQGCKCAHNRSASFFASPHAASMRWWWTCVSDTDLLLQLELEDVSNEFHLMLQELTEWKHAYRTCLVPKQVSCFPSDTQDVCWPALGMTLASSCIQATGPHPGLRGVWPFWVWQVAVYGRTLRVSEGLQESR